VNEFHGHVTKVVQEFRGDTTVGTTASGAMSIVVSDVADFAEEGGKLLLAGADGGVVQTLLRYSGVDDETDTIKLIDPYVHSSSSPLPDGSAVYCWSDTSAAAVCDWVATVADDNGGRPIDAVVKHSLVLLLGDGVRGLAGESVVCLRDSGDQWWLDDVLGDMPINYTPFGQRQQVGGLTIHPTTATVLTFDTFPTMRGGLFVSSGVWYIPKDGRYVITANVQWDAEATGNRRVWFRINGSSDAGGESRGAAVSGAQTAQSVSQIVDLLKDDQVTVMVSQNNTPGSDLNVYATVAMTGLD
jgi:hypothetical protein